MSQFRPSDPNQLAPAATFELRTQAERTTENYASALVVVLTRWAKRPQALDVARRMVAMLETAEPEPAPESR